MKAHRRLFLIIYSSFILIGICKAQGQWVWMHGDSIGNQLGYYGVKGISSPANKPGRRYEAAEWKDQQGNFWIYGGSDNSSGGMLVPVWNDLWKYNPLINEWTWMHGDNSIGQAGVYGVQGVSSPTNRPGSRGYGSCTWVDTSGNLWLFGGYGYDTNGMIMLLDDLWKYDINTNEWTWMKGSNVVGQPAVYGTKGIADPLNTPGEREELSCTWVDNDGNLWLFGGRTLTVIGLLNDLWKYDVLTNQWTWVSGDNIPDQVGVYGTQNISSPLNKPGARQVYSSWKDNNGDLWFFGGQGYASTGQGNLNDLWRYNIATDQWTWMSGSDTANQAGVYGSLCTPSATNIPGARYETRARWVDKCGNFWLFGGFEINDLWRYNTTTNEWTWMSGDNITGQTGVYGIMGVPDPANKPGERGGAVSWIDDDGFWLFGGLSNFDVFNPSWQNDLWKYIPERPAADFTATPDTGCVPLMVNFNNNSSVNCNEIKSYLWNFGDPASGVNDTTSIENPSHQFENLGTYHIKLVVTSCTGGKDSVTKQIIVEGPFNISGE